MTGWLAALLLPTALWGTGRWLVGRRVAEPPFLAHAAIGFLAPAGLLAWRGRPFPEQLLGWAVGVLVWAGAFVIRDAGVFVAFGLLGAAWGAGLGLQTLRPATAAAAGALVPVPPQPTLRDRPDGDAGAASFALEMRCPTCGAALAVPVYHRMVRCEFCASEHVVVRGADTVTAVIPDVLADEQALRESVVRHLRNRRYLELYDQRVRPLVRDAAFGRDPEGGEFPALLATGSAPVVDAVEAEVSRTADAWAARLAPRVKIMAWRRFLAPYWHRFGTLYQSAFGRDAAGAKRMEFTVTTIEGSVRANAAPLPEMGKLSYLRALRPLPGAPEAAIPALAVQCGPDEIDRRVQKLSQRSTELPIVPIAVHATFVPEVMALIYRPWHVVEVGLDGETLAMLVDGGTGRVEGDAPAEELAAAPLVVPPGDPPVLTPSRCPECGADLPFAPDAVACLCRSCFRLVETPPPRWRTVPYLHEEPADGARLMPFWRFPLRLRTSAGALITDLPHLTDGIDGTFDQIGDRPETAQRFFVPAFRTRVSKAGVRLYRRLWPAVQGKAHELLAERFSPARPPARVVEVTLPAAEARAFARVYLALAFTQRDLARAQVKGVRERFLSAQLEGDPDLVFLTLPDELVGPFDTLFGRARVAALADLEGRPDVPGR